MKIFIRASELTEKTPQVLAFYPSDSPATHPELTMLEVPDSVPLAAPAGESFPRLPEGWRERFAEGILQLEAKRRIEEVLSPLEQVATLRESIELIMQHGADVGSWPESARSRKAEIDHVWNYVTEVKARAAATKALPINPTSDKFWPRIVRK
jgi:hypothetical protein